MDGTDVEGRCRGGNEGQIGEGRKEEGEKEGRLGG